jgi:hypothetical protein
MHGLRFFSFWDSSVPLLPNAFQSTRIYLFYFINFAASILWVTIFVRSEFRVYGIVFGLELWLCFVAWQLGTLLQTLRYGVGKCFTRVKDAWLSNRMPQTKDRVKWLGLNFFLKFLRLEDESNSLSHCAHRTVLGEIELDFLIYIRQEVATESKKVSVAVSCLIDERPRWLLTGWSRTWNESGCDMRFRQDFPILGVIIVLKPNWFWWAEIYELV